MCVPHLWTVQARLEISGYSRRKTDYKTVLAILLGVIIGCALPAQTAINNRLKQHVGSPFLALLVSFGIGTLTLFFALALTGQWVSWHTVSSTPWWMWIGGITGIIYLTMNLLLFTRLGAIETVVLTILGQVLMGLMVDQWGWFHSTAHPLTWWRGIGALLVIAGVVGTVMGHGRVSPPPAASHSVSHTPFADVSASHSHTTTVTQPSHSGQLPLGWWRLLGVASGMLSATGTAVNGQLGLALGSPVAAAFASFSMGVLGLLIVVVATRLSLPSLPRGHRIQPWWMWIGGTLGAAFVLGSIILVPWVGTSLTVMIILVGQIAGGQLIDQFGWLSAPRRPVTVVRLCGLVIMFFGVAIIRLL